MTRSNSTPLFFFEGDFKKGDEVQIIGDEASHILRSRRISIGEKISLTDGLGKISVARIDEATPKRSQLSATIETTQVKQKEAIQKVLASAIPKGDRQSVMLDIGSQLGMDVFVPLACRYSVTRFQPKMKERWSRIIKESCKQCRQVYFPTIENEMELMEVLNTNDDGTLILYADHDGLSTGKLALSQRTDITRIIMLVGPEGGFSEQEISALSSSNAVAIRLGQQILRTEAASIAMLAAVNQIIS